MSPISGPSGDVRILDTSSPSSPSTQRNGDLGRDEFLQLMVTQLKNQNPLSPQDGTAFVAQMAQFSSLDQLVGIKDMLRELVRRTPTTPTTPTTPGPGPSGHDTPFGRVGS